MGIVTVAAVKAYLRVEGDGEDAVIADLVAAAEALAERHLRQPLLVRQVVEVVGAGGGWQRLATAPVRAILAVEGVPADGPAFPLPVGGYAIDIDAAGDGWVRVTQPGAAGRVAVRYAAGMAEAADAVPAPVRQGAVRMAAHLFAHRDAADEGAPPAAVAALWQPYRRMRLR